MLSMIQTYMILKSPTNKIIQQLKVEVTKSGRIVHFKHFLFRGEFISLC